MHVLRTRNLGHVTRQDDAHRLAAAFGALLLRSNRAHLYQALIGSQEGLDEATYPVLSGLARMGSATATELAEQIGLDRTVTTRHASRLENAGLLVRRPHSTDARATSLELSASGRRCIEESRVRLDDLLLGTMQDWSAARVTEFTDDFVVVAQRVMAAVLEPA